MIILRFDGLPCCRASCCCVGCADGNRPGADARSGLRPFILFVVNLIGLGLGPTAVAVFTDYVFHDDNMVGYSLLVVNIAAHLLAALTLWAETLTLRPKQE